MGLVIIVGLGVVVFIVASRGGGMISGGITGGSGGYTARGLFTGSIGGPGTNINPLTPVNSSPFGAGGLAMAPVATGAAGGGGVAGDAMATFQGAQQGFAAGGPIGAAVGAAQSLITQLLGQHAARLKGATNENNAALQIVPTFDSFVQTMVQYINTGLVPKAQAAQALASFDQQIYQQLRSLVGAPGTAWSDSMGMAGRCDKTCTVGCCLYYSDLGPPLSLLRLALGDSSGAWGAGDPRISADYRTITVPKVYPGKYSSYSRPLYTVTINA